MKLGAKFTDYTLTQKKGNLIKVAFLLGKSVVGQLIIVG